MKVVIKRMQSATPPFFKKLRLIGLGLVSVAASIAHVPLELPGIVCNGSGYLATAGAVIALIAQLTVDDKVLKKETSKPDH